MDPKYNPINLKLDTCNYTWFKKENEKSADLLPMPPPPDGNEEEVKVGIEIKILTPDKLLTRLQLSLTRIKAANESNKLKNEIKQIVYLLYRHNKITKHFTTI